MIRVKLIETEPVADEKGHLWRTYKLIKLDKKGVNINGKTSKLSKS